jgi:hypothetical protein
MWASQDEVMMPKVLMMRGSEPYAVNVDPTALENAKEQWRAARKTLERAGHANAPKGRDSDFVSLADAEKWMRALAAIGRGKGTKLAEEWLDNYFAVAAAAAAATTAAADDDRPPSADAQAPPPPPPDPSLTRDQRRPRKRPPACFEPFINYVHTAFPNVDELGAHAAVAADALEAERERVGRHKAECDRVKAVAAADKEAAQREAEKVCAEVAAEAVNLGEAVRPFAARVQGRLDQERCVRERWPSADVLKQERVLRCEDLCAKLQLRCNNFGSGNTPPKDKDPPPPTSVGLRRIEDAIDDVLGTLVEREVLPNGVVICERQLEVCTDMPTCGRLVFHDYPVNHDGVFCGVEYMDAEGDLGERVAAVRLGAVHMCRSLLEKAQGDTRHRALLKMSAAYRSARSAFIVLPRTITVRELADLKDDLAVTDDKDPALLAAHGALVAHFVSAAATTAAKHSAKDAAAAKPVTDVELLEMLRPPPSVAGELERAREQRRQWNTIGGGARLRELGLEVFELRQRLEDCERRDAVVPPPPVPSAKAAVTALADFYRAHHCFQTIDGGGEGQQLRHKSGENTAAALERIIVDHVLAPQHRLANKRRRVEAAHSDADRLSA